MQIKDKANISINGRIIFLVGSVIIIIAPFLTYITVLFNLERGGIELPYNMWGASSVSEANSFDMGPFAAMIMVIGIIGVLIAIIEIKTKKDFNVIVNGVIPVAAILMLILFEVIALADFKEGIRREGNDMLNVSRGIGLYMLIVGIVICVLSLLIMIKKTDDNTSAQT